MGLAKGVEVPATSSQACGTGFAKYFNWKTASATAPLCASFGALLAADPASSIPKLIGGGLTGDAAMAASAVVFGTFGAVFGVRAGMVSNEISNFYTKILSGKMFEETSEKSPEKPVLAQVRVAALPSPAQPALVQSPVVQPESITAQRDKVFATSAKKFSLDEILAREDKGESADKAWTRV